MKSGMNLINHTLINEYGWETDSTTPSTPELEMEQLHFIISYTELFVVFLNMTFRNNQVLNLKLSREKAIDIVKAENEPRFEKIERILRIDRYRLRINN